MLENRMGHAKKSKDVLQWWIQNLKNCSSRLIIHGDCFVTIKIYASKNCGKVNGNVISQTNENESNSFSNWQQNSLDVFTKNRRYRKQKTFKPKGIFTKGIWDYLLKYGIMIAMEYLPSCIDVEVVGNKGTQEKVLSEHFFLKYERDTRGFTYFPLACYIDFQST